MKFTYQSVIQKHLHNIQADVSASAYSESIPGWRQELTPDFYRLWYIEKGTLWIKHGEQEYLAGPGNLVFIPAGFSHSLGTHGRETLGRYWCHFRANLGNHRMFELVKVPYCLEAPDRPQVVGRFQSMIAAYKSDTLTKGLQINAALFELLSYYLEHCQLTEENLVCTETFGKLSAALQYVEDHLSENILLEDLAKAAFLHPNYFIGIFKSALGCSPIQYVNQRRLERAKLLLVEEEISVAEVAAQVGMQNHYLSRLFKLQTGLSPSRYRQIYGKGQAVMPEADAADTMAAWMDTTAQASLQSTE